MLEPDYRAGKFSVEPLSLSLKLKEAQAHRAAYEAEKRNRGGDQ